jgi:hypothetical protein
MNVERLRCLYKVIGERNENKNKNTAKKKKLPLNFASLSNDYKNNTIIIIILQTPTAMNNTLFFHRIIIKK